MKIGSLALIITLALHVPAATLITMTSDNPKWLGAIVQSSESFARPDNAVVGLTEHRV